VTTPSQRLLSLQRQHKTLLGKIVSKQKEAERLQSLVDQVERELTQRVEPLAASCRSLNAEIWHMFQALLASAPTKRARRSVREVFDAMLSQGIVLPVEDASDPDSGARAEPDGDADNGSHAGARRGGYSAAPKGAEPGRESLKALFKRLTVAFHPDRTQDAVEKLERTSVMQAITQAYQTGDLASLLKLERRSQTQTPENPGSDPLGECAALERMIEELRLQFGELKQKARELERHEVFEFCSPSRDDRRYETLDRFVKTVEAELDELTRIRDFVAAFRDKKLTLDEFLCGPLFQFGGAEFDFDDLVRTVAAPPEAERGRATRRRNRNRRSRDQRR